MLANIDIVIRLKIPNSELNYLLYDIVKSTNIHSPCEYLNRNLPCMFNGSCSQRYLSLLSKEKHTVDDGYFQYRRRSPSDSGFSLEISRVIIHNKWVVPYYPVLSRSFMAYINMELCKSVNCIKYIFKYINKGSD